MNFIQRELERIGITLQQSQPDNRYAELYAAQQALAWANEPDGFATPFVVITGTQEGKADCSVVLHLPQSSDICCHSG